MSFWIPVQEEKYSISLSLDYLTSMRLFKRERNLVEWDGISIMNLIKVILKLLKLFFLIYYQQIRVKYHGRRSNLSSEISITVVGSLMITIVNAFYQFLT